MGFFSRLFGSDGPKPDFEAAKKARAEFLANPNLVADDQDRAFNFATELMVEQEFQECIDAYRSLAVQFPKQAGLCEGQIGAAQYFLGQYDAAIESYLSALDKGADESMMDDNVFEAVEALASTPGGRAYVERYVSRFPSGKHLKKARKLLG